MLCVGCLQVLDPTFRAPFANVNRWFMTIVNQPQFKKVLGEVKLCETMAKFDGMLLVLVAVSLDTVCVMWEPRTHQFMIQVGLCEHNVAAKSFMFFAPRIVPCMPRISLIASVLVV